MKISMIAQHFYPAIVGGAEWYVYNMAKELIQLGHEVTVFTLDRYRGNKLEGSLDRQGITIERIAPLLDLSYRAKFWPNLIKKIRKSNSEIHHCLDYLLFHTMATTFLKNRSTPVCTTVFDVHHLVPRNKLKSKLVQGLDFSLGRYILNHANKILLRAPTLIDSLNQMGVDSKKIEVTPSGVRREEMHLGDPTLFHNEFNISGPIVLYLGRLHPMKGPQFLLKAAKLILEKNPDTQFVFVGPDHAIYRSTLEKLASQLNIEKNIHFTGPIYDIPRKASAMAASDVFVMPSGYEGTSQSIFLAMVQGKPVVATCAGGIPFQVRHRKEGFLCGYGDFQAISQYVIQLLNNKDLAKTMGQTGRKRVLSNFTYPILAKQLETIYKEMLDN